ncbi:MAG: ABC-F family ATP-binding cassette domain-containing protein [Lachnospiraceae bacterium]|nr:ABC-F family ATP-binding cassette domain-containing protein [Lachnospiraceae bacterium]
MLYEISDGTVSLGGNEILSHIDFGIRGTEKIAVVGRNGAGKTTLFRLLAGEISLDRDDKRVGPGIVTARKLDVGYLKQTTEEDASHTVEEILMEACPAEDAFSKDRYAYEAEYDTLLTGFGLRKEEKSRKLGSFSGGEQTKIALIRLLLMKPDILLLDEPTNHLDVETTQWLEEYLKRYPKAVVFISHDRYFIDRVAAVVYEVTDHTLVRYAGNYTAYRQQKQEHYLQQKKAYERDEAEAKRLEELIEKFKNKPRKASFARSRKKILERMERTEKPKEMEAHLFTGEIVPAVSSGKWVVEAEHLKIGYDVPLMELSLRLRKGQKLAIVGENGVGKSTLLKTIAGILPKLDGKCTLGNRVETGYFDQQSAELASEKTVLEYFMERFPALLEADARKQLAAYLFGGRLAAQKVSSLSGGEKARLKLAEILCARPNFLILDEPTNHMDIPAKETLESAFVQYQGTMLIVSHDRYLVSHVADALLILTKEGAKYYPFGYDHYLERKKQGEENLKALRDTEEQVLIEGLKAVPKAERHETRPLTTEEAYVDWKVRLAEEPLHAALSKVEDLNEALSAATTFEEWCMLKEKLDEAEAELTKVSSDWWEEIQF